MNERVPAEVFPPGEFIREELVERGWSQLDLAEILGRYPQVVNELILGKRSVTPETAMGLGDAFGTGAEFWLNLESAYQLSKASKPDDAIQRRSNLFAVAPVRDMVRRGWIEHSDNVTVLEKRVLEFFEIQSLNEQPNMFPHAARKSTPYEEATTAQKAWFFRAKKLAKVLRPKKFSNRSFEKGLKRLKEVLPNAEELRQINAILSDMGIRFVVLEHLPSTRIDGVCFWLDEQSPVIAISIRYDRIDWFWHTLMHELAHVNNKDGLFHNGAIDADLVGDDAQPFAEKPEFEKAADRFAASFSVPKDRLDDFVVRKGTLFSHKKILGFSRLNRVHPGIVVGQLQYRKMVKFSHYRLYLVKIRDIVTSTALTDGWNQHPPAIE